MLQTLLQKHNRCVANLEMFRPARNLWFLNKWWHYGKFFLLSSAPRLTPLSGRRGGYLRWAGSRWILLAQEGGRKARQDTGFGLFAVHRQNSHPKQRTGVKATAPGTPVPLEHGGGGSTPGKSHAVASSSKGSSSEARKQLFSADSEFDAPPPLDEAPPPAWDGPALEGEDDEMMDGEAEEGLSQEEFDQALTLARDLKNKGQFEAAEILFAKCLKLLDQVEGPGVHTVYLIFERLPCTNNLRQFDKTCELAERALKILSIPEMAGQVRYH